MRLTPQGHFTAELRGLSQPLAQSTLQIYGPACRADLGDQKCNFPIKPPVIGRDQAVQPGAFYRVATGIGAGFQVYQDRIYEVTAAGTTDAVQPHRRLAEAFVFRVHRPGAGQVQHRPQQHRGMTVRQNEAVAIWPDRVLRIEAHDPVPERVDQRRQRHRCAGMARIRLLDRVDGERADRVDRKLIEVFRRHVTQLPVPASDGARSEGPRDGRMRYHPLRSEAPRWGWHTIAAEVPAQ